MPGGAFRWLSSLGLCLPDPALNRNGFSGCICASNFRCSHLGPLEFKIFKDLDHARQACALPWTNGYRQESSRPVACCTKTRNSDPWSCIETIYIYILYYIIYMYIYIEKYILLYIYVVNIVLLEKHETLASSCCVACQVWTSQCGCKSRHLNISKAWQDGICVLRFLQQLLSGVYCDAILCWNIMQCSFDLLAVPIFSLALVETLH
jgi:hypothetical protein